MSDKVKKAYRELKKDYKKIRNNKLSEMEEEYELKNLIKFLEKELDDDDKGVKSHSKYVAYIATEIVEKLNERYDEDVIDNESLLVIVYSAILHDIGKYKKRGREHSNAGAEFIRKKSENKIFDKVGDDISDICDIVYFHNRTIQISVDNIEDDVLRLMVKIVHDADKVSKIFKYKTWENKEHDGVFDCKEYKGRKRMVKEIEKISKMLLLRESEMVFDEIIDSIKEQIT